MKPEWAFYPGQELPQVGDTFIVVRISDAIDLHWGPVKMVVLEQIKPEREEAKETIDMEKWNAFGEELKRKRKK